MRILSIFTCDPATMKTPEPEDYQRMEELIEEMKSKGVLVDTGGVMSDSLQLRYARRNGKDTVTDGPFAEAKEVIGGFGLLEVADRDEALYWARRFLDLAGDGTCEIRGVTSAG